ncbi:secretion system protein E [Caulobacter sp. Root655]|nr:secretion system protein E [Caulobacter sp. Root655]
MTRARNADPGADQRRELIEALLDAGLIDGAALGRAELVSTRTGQPVEQVLNQLGALSDDDLVAAYAKVSGCEVWDPRAAPIAADPFALGVSAEFLRRGRILPIRQTKAGLVCAVCDPLDNETLSGLVFATGLSLSLLVARPSDWRRGFEALFAEGGGEPAHLDERRLEREIDQVSDGASEGAGARLVASAFEAAIALGASDIHFEPRRNDLAVRLRVDGRMVDHQVVSADLAPPAVSRIKVIANLNLGERRLPQDGRTTFVIGGRSVDVRVATSPTVFGESAVLRILDRAAVPLDLNRLGLSADVVSVLSRAARTPHGLFLVTGPTGSGKTTTLYALLQTFAGSSKKVLSIEDPVEYHFEHVSQTQAAPHLGLTFAAALRSFLRQDPDVILVGEIRDPETAAVAIQAAMTGHLVLASIHANDALAVAPRLRDMGIEPYQLAAGFRGAMAQRLVRRLCPDCRVEDASGQSAGWVEGRAIARRFHPVGCPKCKGMGYRGRVPVSEGFLADDDLQRAFAEQGSPSELARMAKALGLVGMLNDGLDMVEAGITSLEEVLAAVHG